MAILKSLIKEHLRVRDIVGASSLLRHYKLRGRVSERFIDSFTNEEIKALSR